MVRGAKGSLTVEGRVNLSPDGRFAISTPLVADRSGYHFVTDLPLGSSSLVSGSVLAGQQQVTNAGVVLTAYSQAVVLTDLNGATRVIRTQPSLYQAAIDQAGKTLYYSTMLQPTNEVAELFAVDLDTGNETRLDGNINIKSISVTADGQNVLYIADSLRIATLGTGTNRVVNTHRYSSVVISGDGRIGYGLAAGGGIERIDILTGATSSVSPAPPNVQAYLSSGEPITNFSSGSVVTVVSPNQQPFSIVSVYGSAAQPIASARATEFQIPFDQPEGPCEVVIGSGAYETALEFQISPAYPRFLYGYGIFAHSNFRPVTNISPAVPGETIVTYMTGLGPVDGRNLLIAPLTCEVNGLPADVSYAGLEADYPGVYQINLRIPTLVSLPATLSCQVPGAAQATAEVPIRVVPNP